MKDSKQITFRLLNIKSLDLPPFGPKHETGKYSESILLCWWAVYHWVTDWILAGQWDLWHMNGKEAFEISPSKREREREKRVINSANIFGVIMDVYQPKIAYSQEGFCSASGTFNLALTFEFCFASIEESRNALLIYFPGKTGSHPGSKIGSALYLKRETRSNRLI